MPYRYRCAISIKKRFATILSKLRGAVRLSLTETLPRSAGGIAEDAMKYICLVYYNEHEVYGMPEADWNALVGECLAHGDWVRETGRHVASEALQPVDTATTVRVRNGKTLTTDGPFAETKEQLAGFYLIEAADLNEALQVAAHIPPARYGSIEVRPIRELPRPEATASHRPANDR